MTSQDITSTGSATGSRRHPRWGTEPSKPEASVDSMYTLVNDLSGARYRRELRGRTYLVSAALDCIEKGDGSALSYLKTAAGL